MNFSWLSICEVCATIHGMDWNVLGHEWAETLLKQHIVRDQVRHAYLLTGPPGVGRRTLALRFSQALNCLQPPSPGACCGVCRMCTQIERMQQVDLSLVTAEKVGGTLKVDQIRALQHTLSLTPYEANYRVAVLQRFEEAHISAQNALLKTLEEPPDKVILILTVDTAENLLPTIISRCEVLRLRPLSIERLAEALRDRWQIPPEEARMLAHLSGGRTGKAVYFHRNPEALETRREWVEDFLRLLGNSRRERFAYAEPFKKKEREEIREFYQVWLSFWRDIMLVASGADVPLVNLEWQKDIRFLAGVVGVHSARICTANLEQGMSKLEQNLNRQLLTEVLLMDWPRVNGIE